MINFQFSNETVALIILGLLGLAACKWPEGATAALPIATGIIGWLKGKTDATNT